VCGFSSGAASYSVGANSTAYAVTLLSSGTLLSVAELTIRFAASLDSRIGIHAVAGSDAGYRRDFEAWYPRPFDRDLWAPGQLQGETWTPVFQAAESWIAGEGHSASWMPAYKQPENWEAD
jgi:hypothetical protein